jgi:broad specificity phosphatase PhoE
MTATVLLIRHAAHVDLNRRLSGRRQGVSLSEAGRAQADVLGRHLARRDITRVECSPLERTWDTAAIIAQRCGLSAPVATDALIEVDFGDWTGRAFDSFAEDPQWDAWNVRRGSATVPGGESMATAQGRIVDHLQAVAAAAGGETIAMVSHADMIRAAVAHVLGLPLDHLLRFDIDPASVTAVRIEDWGARLLSLNEKGQ